MHAIVMVHKMQSMTLSNHQLVPPTSKSEQTPGDKDDQDSGDPPPPALPSSCPSPLLSASMDRICALHANIYVNLRCIRMSLR